MKTERVLGFLLLLVGLSVIGYTLFASFQIFSNKAAPPQLFSEERAAASLKTGAKDLQGQIEGAIGDQLKAFIPSSAIPRMLNLLAWSFLASLLILGGTQVAGLGIKLLKP